MHRSILLSILPFVLVTATLAASNRDTETLQRAQQMQLQIRQGNPAVAQPLVKMLEDAVAQSPDNAQLWEQLGNANMALQGTLYTGPMDVPALIKVGERGREAYARSLALNPDKALVRAGHGMAQMVVSQLKGDGPGMMAGIDEMNAAIRQAPKSTAVRLTRGFTIIHLPPAMRDTPAVIEDLKFILDTAPGGRPEDVLHVLLGDVYSEMGNAGAARAEYELVTGASAFAAEQAKSRLKTGTTAPADILQVRMGTGTNCAMCHAPGTDR